MIRSRQNFIGTIFGIVLVLSPVSAAAQLLGAIGGIEGLGEKGTDAPIFTMSGRATLDEGEGVVGAGFTYLRFTREFGEDIENPVSEFGTLQDDNRAIENTAKSLSLAYGVTSNFGLSASIPFITRRLHVTDTSTGTVVGDTATGIGNISVSGSYQFSSEPDFSGRVLVIFPSGFEVGSDFLILGADLAYSTKLGESSSLNFQAGYRYSDQDRKGRAQLDSVIFNAGLAKAIGDRFVLTMEINSLFLVGGDDLEGEIYQDAPTQYAVDFLPGFKLGITDSISMAAAVRLALINQLALGYDAVYTVLVGYGF